MSVSDRDSELEYVWKYECLRVRTKERLLCQKKVAMLSKIADIVLLCQKKYFYFAFMTSGLFAPI